MCATCISNLAEGIKAKQMPTAWEGEHHIKAMRSKTKHFRGVYAGMKVVANVKLYYLKKIQIENNYFFPSVITYIAMNRVSRMS
jgi:hypothetical protein